MKKKALALFSLILILIIAIFALRNYLFADPLYRAYLKLRVGMDAQEAVAIADSYYYGSGSGNYKESGASDTEKNTEYIRWGWQGETWDWLRALLPIRPDYDENAELEIKITDGKVVDATYIYNRYFYPIGTGTYRNRGFCITKDECLVPHPDCPSNKNEIYISP